MCIKSTKKVVEMLHKGQMAIINIGYDYTIEEPADLDGKLLRQQGRPEHNYRL